MKGRRDGSPDSVAEGPQSLFVAGFLSLFTLFALAIVTMVTVGVPATAHADEGSAKLEKDAKRLLKRGTAGERRDLAKRATLADDPAAGFRVGLSGLKEANGRLRKAVTRRDKQGAVLFAFWKRYVMKRNSSREDYTEVRAYEIENGKVSKQVQAATEERALFADVVDTTSRNLDAEATETLAALAEKVRKSVARTTGGDGKGAVIGALAGPLIPTLKEDLHEWSLHATSRPVATGALRALMEETSAVDAARLAPCAEREDPIVRRTFYRLLAAVRDVPSIDLLVARVAKETGTPLFELVQILRRISSTKLTADARAWKDWWASAREDWTRPDGAENDDPFEMKETSRYFGLRLRSTRILFILDRSLSMDWPVDSYYSKDRGGTVAGSGERKIDIAKRELTRALDTLDASCSFNVLVYGTTVKLMNQRPQSATAPNLERARKWIKKLKLEGSTNLSGALLEGFENTRPGQPLADASIADTIVVLTDGEPNGGPIADEDDTLAELKRLNPHGMIRVHTVFLGIDGDAKFMRSLAEQNDGQFIHFKK